MTTATKKPAKKKDETRVAPEPGVKVEGKGPQKFCPKRGKNMGRYLLFVALVVASGQAWAASLHLELDAVGSMEYVTTNSGVIPWSSYGGDTYLMPNYQPRPIGYYGNDEVQVTYEVPLGFYAQSASIFVRTNNPYGEAIVPTYAKLDVSPNGIDWAELATNETVDIGGLVQNATSIYVRGRLWSYLGPTACQWIFTPSGGSPGFVLDVAGTAEPVPEPQTFALGLMALSALLVVYRRR